MTFVGQNSYNLAPVVGRIGALADGGKGINAPARVASVAIPFGCLSVRDADDLKAKLPTSAAEVLAACQGSGGIAVGAHSIISADGANDPAVATFPIGKEFAQLRRGSIFVIVEEAVTQGDPVYVRFANHVAAQNAAYLANGGSADQKGAFRKSADAAAAVAQVATVTPTAANTTLYVIEVSIGGNDYVGEYLSDADATATEIVTGLKAALGVIPGIAQTGTGTLILTSSVAGVPFSVKNSGDGVLTVVATTANVAGVPSAAICPGMYYKSSAAAGGIAIVSANLGGT